MQNDFPNVGWGWDIAVVEDIIAECLGYFGDAEISQSPRKPFDQRFELLLSLPVLLL